MSTSTPFPGRPTEPRPTEHDPVGSATLLTYLSNALWGRAIDALRAGRPWALGRSPRTVLRQVLNTAPIDVLNDLLELGLPMHPVPGALGRPLLSAWFAQAPSGSRRMAVLDRLLVHGVDVNLADAVTCTTFLAEACRAGQAHDALALLDRGADPNRPARLLAREDWIRAEDRDDWLLNGWTPLHLIAQWPLHWTGGPGLAQRLLDAGADPQARTELPWSTTTAMDRHLLCQPPTVAERQAGRGWTPLEIAQRHGLTELGAVLERWEMRQAIHEPADVVAPHRALRERL